MPRAPPLCHERRTPPLAAPRGRQVASAKFRRQHQFRPYILDFYCHEARLAIEVDGNQHAAQVERDELRTRYLESQGLRVVRFTNREVLTETEAVLDSIWDVVEGPSPHPPP